MLLKNLVVSLSVLVLATVPAPLLGQQVDGSHEAESAAPLDDLPLILRAEAGQEGKDACAKSALAPFDLGQADAVDSASPALQASLCMCERCLCSACDCSGGVFKVRCCSFALGDICLAASTCFCAFC